MQQQLRTQLEAFDKLPKDQQEIRIHQADRFSALTPERKSQIRSQMQALGKLEKERRSAVVVTLRRLYVMPEADRQRVMSSDDFKSRFSADEQKMIADLSEVFLPPM
jgi:hypothetical protein